METISLVASLLTLGGVLGTVVVAVYKFRGQVTRIEKGVAECVEALSALVSKIEKTATDQAATASEISKITGLQHELLKQTVDALTKIAGKK